VKVSGGPTVREGVSRLEIRRRMRVRLAPILL
jgi:hypothetical protein